MELRDMMSSDRRGGDWNALDIDLPIESLENSERFPGKFPMAAWRRASNRRAAQTLGDIRFAKKSRRQSS